MHFKAPSLQIFEFAQDSLESAFSLISEESDDVIESKMTELFPVDARKVQGVPYVIEPSKFVKRLTSSSLFGAKTDSTHEAIARLADVQIRCEARRVEYLAQQDSIRDNLPTCRLLQAVFKVHRALVRHLSGYQILATQSKSTSNLGPSTLSGSRARIQHSSH